MSNKSLAQILKELKYGKKIEKFTDTEQDTIVTTVEHTDPTRFTDEEREIIYNAYKIIKEHKNNTPIWKKLIIIIIAAIIIYLIWKILKKFMCTKNIKILAVRDVFNPYEGYDGTPAYFM